MCIRILLFASSICNFDQRASGLHGQHSGVGGEHDVANHWECLDLSVSFDGVGLVYKLGWNSNNDLTPAHVFYSNTLGNTDVTSLYRATNVIL